MSIGDVIVFKERAGKPGGGKGILIGYNHTFTLATQMIDTVCYRNKETDDASVGDRQPSRGQQDKDSRGYISDSDV